MGKYLADSYDAALRENADLKTRLASVERERDEIMAMAERREDALRARLAEAERANAELNIEVSRLYACRNECDDVDRILRDGLRLDPERYRTEGGALNVPKILAAIKHPNDYPRLADSASVGAICVHGNGWPCDLCVTEELEHDTAMAKLATPDRESAAP